MSNNLNEIKQMYVEYANNIPNWKKLDKNELCNLYIQNEDNEFLKSCYFSAIILNYWPKIYSLYQNTCLTATYEDVYDWVVEGILYALKKRRWLQEDSHIYNDPNGPDKAINRKIKCIRLNFLAHENRDKRKVHINLLSIDSFENPDDFIEGKSQQFDYLEEYIKQTWDNKKYLQAIILDILSYDNCSVRDSNNNLNLNKLINIIYNNIDNNYINYFINKYNITDNINNILYKLLYQCRFVNLWNIGDCRVKKSFNEIENLVTREFNKLAKNEELKNLLC